MRTTLLVACVVLTAVGPGCVADDPVADVGSKRARLDTTSTSLTATGTIARDEQQLFSFVPPAADGFVVVHLSGTGDADLFTDENVDPTPDDNQCASEQAGSDELCIHAHVDGVLFVKLIGWARVSDYVLHIDFRGIGTTPDDGTGASTGDGIGTTPGGGDQ